MTLLTVKVNDPWFKHIVKTKQWQQQLNYICSIFFILNSKKLFVATRVLFSEEIRSNWFLECERLPTPGLEVPLDTLVEAVAQAT